MIYRHPEWKRWWDELGGRLELGQFWDYDSLTVLGGIDPRDRRGRAQFLRFRTEVMTKMDLWLENVIGQGYRVIEAREHGEAANRRINGARRRLRVAGQIVHHTRVAELTTDERKAHADLACRVSRLAQAWNHQQPAIREALRGLSTGRLPSPVVPMSNKPVAETVSSDEEN